MFDLFDNTAGIAKVQVLRFASVEAAKTMIHTVTRDAVLIHKQHAYSEWIPLSLIHGADCLRLSRAMRGDILVLRIADWKVRQIGLQVEKRT